MLDPLSIIMLTVYTIVIVIPLIYNYLSYNDAENRGKSEASATELGSELELPKSLVILVNNPEDIDVEEIVSMISKSYT